MKTIDEKDFSENLFYLLRETFEGPPPQTSSAFLDQGGGLFQTIDPLTAADASRPSLPGAPTIAAHCAHARFYVDVLRRFMRGSTEKADWAESWRVQSVSADEWERLKQDLRAAYASLLEELRAVENWNDETVGGGMAIIAHTAYHLGAIRQLARGLR
ncbi:MAG TPA: DinB family protein [Pyrinomonadaceae bacterium]